MTDVTLTEAKARLSELVALAEAGNPIRITRHGRPVAQLSAVTRTLKPIDAEALARLTDALPAQTEPAADLMRRLRDGQRL